MSLVLEGMSSVCPCSLHLPQVFLTTPAMTLDIPDFPPFSSEDGLVAVGKYLGQRHVSVESSRTIDWVRNGEFLASLSLALLLLLLLILFFSLFSWHCVHLGGKEGQGNLFTNSV